MDLMACVFYAGVFVHLWDRDRTFLQCVLWPFAAGKIFGEFMDRHVNATTPPDAGKEG